VSAGVPRPLPLLAGLAGEFYGFCRAGELRFQRCAECGRWRHVPRERCAGCASKRFSWERSSGRGRVYTWTVAVRSLHPAFPAERPAVPVVVEMEEGVRVVSEVVDCAPAELRIGLPVEVAFEEAAPGVVLPKFRRAAGEGGAR
jgi:uncharacterized OB-fold protein